MVAFRLVETVRRFDIALTRATEVAVVLIGGAFTILIFLEVASRFVVDFSIFAINALARLLLLWFFLLGAGLALRKRLHVGFEQLKRSLPSGPARVLECLVHLCIFAFCAELLWSIFFALPASLGQTLGSLGISSFWGVLAFPVGIALMIHHQIMLLFEQPPWRSVNASRDPRIDAKPSVDAR